MEQNLQTVIDFINKNIYLSEEEKASLISNLKETDKKITITEFKLDRTEKVKRTTAILLEETIEELEQKRKSIETQNRELEIESSLERVRTQAMGMRKPDDLVDICKILFNELRTLGFNELRNVLITIFNDDKGFFRDYNFSDHTGVSITNILYHTHPVIDDYLNQIKTANDAFAELALEGNRFDDWKEFRRKSGQRYDPKLENITALYYYFYSIGTGAIGISTFKPVTSGQLSILKRFRNVFDLAYRRYIDITNAEAQAREAQIEAALERIRSRTMAMQKSDELAETAAVVFKQLISLGIEPNRLYIAIIKDESGDIEFWITDEDGTKVSTQFTGNVIRNMSVQKMYDAWKAQKKSITIDMQDKELENYFHYLGDELHVSFKQGLSPLIYSVKGIDV